MTKTEFVELTNTMKNLFPKDGLIFTKDIVSVWYECLKDLDYRRAKEGVILYANENQWIPSIADIRKYASKIPKYTQEEIHQFIVESEKNGGGWFDEV